MQVTPVPGISAGYQLLAQLRKAPGHLFGSINPFPTVTDSHDSIFYQLLRAHKCCFDILKKAFKSLFFPSLGKRKSETKLLSLLSTLQQLHECCTCFKVFPQIQLFWFWANHFVAVNLTGDDDH